MANTGGTCGTVSIISDTGSGSGVWVVFPMLSGPPAQAAHTDCYDPAPSWAMAGFRDDGRPLKDVAVDGSGNPTTVVSHK